jgi:hypothetical protein
MTAYLHNLTDTTPLRPGRPRRPYIFALMLQNLDALWDTQAQWEVVTTVVFQDCMHRHGV